MNKCYKCSIKVEENLKICPLCLNKLDHKPTTENSREYPIYKKSDISIWNFTLFIMSYIFTFFTIITFLINIMTWNGHPWFIFVLSSFIYIWVLLRYTIYGNNHFGSQVVIQFFGISLFLTIIDILDKELSWSINFVIPFLIIISNLIITIKITTKKIKWRDYSVFLIILILMGTFPMIFYFVGLTKILWPSISAMIYTFLTFVVFFTFSFKKFSRELHKIFHFIYI